MSSSFLIPALTGTAWIRASWQRPHVVIPAIDHLRYCPATTQAGIKRYVVVQSQGCTVTLPVCTAVKMVDFGDASALGAR